MTNERKQYLFCSYENDVTGEVLPTLNRSSLQEFGIRDEEKISRIVALLGLFNKPSTSISQSVKRYHKVFNDPVHGHIEVHPLCIKIIDTPQFQRLRNIKQLGGCYFVFPGAAHNRFEHSIGTSYLAGKLVKSLQKRQQELDIKEKDVLSVIIAGLCHDLGHGPFSHMFDGQFIPAARPEIHWKHEEASVQMFDYLVDSNNLKQEFVKYDLDQQDLTFIKELIAGPRGDTPARTQDWPYFGREKCKSYLYEIVANKRTGIDVDKWDYFARDCHNLGIKNSFDHKRFIKMARVINVENKLQICVRDKEAGNIYDMFHTRFCLFIRAYQHKTSNIIETMMTEALLKANPYLLFEGKDGKKLKMSEAIDDMVAYSKVTDQVYYQILHGSDSRLEEAKKILQLVECRSLYKCIGQTILKKPREKEEAHDISKDIADSVPPDMASGTQLEPEDIIVHLITFDYGMKNQNPIDNLRFYTKENPSQAMRFRKDQVSRLLPESFAEQHMRIYCRKRDEDSIEKAKAAFFQWTLGQECTTPKFGDSVAELTPMKSTTADGQSGGVAQKLQFNDEIEFF
ncbi:deoxynucleoside triphosphate triphosphohydrolase SAMHD1-like [Actinia tenebrosa]|uniref:Deoxynucleoside triphosphate triphosphohydrolase SAMHD1 n=1 Tax=Actinia tenebrosa TaxID=6105 RepID=A0A6P8IE44_ACTTE|nr:deoxynucleoside triphosphate triphosphohydrolase SAMHD1-like [Actinia tenebrosa]